MIDVWELLESSFPIIVSELRDAERDLPIHPIEQIAGWQRLLDFLLFEERAINGEIVCNELQRRAYHSPAALNMAYGQLVEGGYAIASGDLFSITQQGKQQYLDYVARRSRAYENTPILAVDDFETYLCFLQKGYRNAKEVDYPAWKPGLALGYVFYSNLGGGQLGALLGWINLFELYRDDVHAFAWRSAGFSGITIETLTRLWQGEATSAPELADQLAFRGYSVADYRLALEELASSGFVTGSGMHFALTDAGREIRDRIEAQTVQMFDRFCSEAFTEEEIVSLQAVIERL